MVQAASNMKLVESPEPMVGVIVTCYNKVDFVADAIESVRSQHYPNIDLVVVDDGSTDGTRDALEICLKGTSATTVFLQNAGVSNARNMGYEHVREDAKYLYFLDGDDVLEPAAVATLVDHLEAHPSVGLVYAGPTCIDESGDIIEMRLDETRWTSSVLGRIALPDEIFSTPLESIFARFAALPSGSLFRRSSFSSTTGWDSSLCRPARSFHAEDKDMAIQMALIADVHRLPSPIFRYRILPTPHRSSMYDGLRAVNIKWWNIPIPRKAQLRVRKSIRFDARVATIDAAMDWAASFRTTVPRAIWKSTLRLAMCMTRSITLPLRMTFADKVYPPINSS